MKRIRSTPEKPGTPSKKQRRAAKILNERIKGYQGMLARASDAGLSITKPGSQKMH